MTAATARDGRLAFRALDLTVQRRLDGLLSGEHQGSRLGPGTEAEELTRYRPGHEVRRIDWNATARAREPQVWLTRSEHELTTWLLLDQTASMAFGTAEQEKAELAAQVAGAVGLLVDGPGNRLGVGLIGTDGLRWLPPQPGRVAALRTMTAATISRSGPAPIDLPEAIAQLGRRHRRPGLRVIVSDLIDPAGTFARPFDWEPALRRLALRHDVIVAELIDPRELDLPDVGQLVLVDPESGRQRDVDTTDRGLRTAYAEAAARHRVETADAVRGARAGHLLLRTDQDWVLELARFVRTRRRLTARRTIRRQR